MNRAMAAFAISVMMSFSSSVVAAPDLAPQKTKSAQTSTVRTHEPSPEPEATRHLQACQTGDAAMCHAAALDAYYKPSDPVTDRAAFELFKKACEAGYAPSCNGLGLLYAEGRGTIKDLPRAVQLYRAACVAGASTGCDHLATALQRGLGIAKDEAAAARAQARSKCILQKTLSDRKFADCPKI